MALGHGVVLFGGSFPCWGGGRFLTSLPLLEGDPGEMLEFSVLIPGCVCVSPGLLPAWAELHSPGPGRVPSVAGAVAQALLSAPRYLWEGEHTQKPSLGTPGEFWVMGGTLSPSGLTPHTCAQVSLSCRALVSDCSPEERKTGVGWECGTRSPVLPPCHSQCSQSANFLSQCCREPPMPTTGLPSYPGPTPVPPQCLSQSTQCHSQLSQSAQCLPQCPPVPLPVSPVPPSACPNLLPCSRALAASEASLLAHSMVLLSLNYSQPPE